MTATLGLDQGFVKPTRRPRHNACYVPMGKAKTRRKKVASPMRTVIAINVTRRAKKVFLTTKNLPMLIVKASAEAVSERMTKSNVQSILAAKSSVTLEQLDGLAHALDLAPYQLLIENLDPENPQIVKGATADEQELYRRIAKEAVKEALQYTTSSAKPAKTR